MCDTPYGRSTPKPRCPCLQLSSLYVRPDRELFLHGPTIPRLGFGLSMLLHLGPPCAAYRALAEHRVARLAVLHEPVLPPELQRILPLELYARTTLSVRLGHFHSRVGLD